MAVPARKVSKTRKRMRRSHNALKQQTLVECKNCKKMIKPHRVCPYCGYYKGVQVIDVKKAKKDETVNA